MSSEGPKKKPTGDTDSRIVNLLQQNADLTYREMAKKLKLNESTVRKRVIALKEKGIIRKYLVDVDAAKLGFRGNAMLGVDVQPHKIMDVGKQLTKIPEARLVFSTSGENDFHVIVWTFDRESLSRVVNKVSSIEGVIKVTPNITLERLK